MVHQVVSPVTQTLHRSCRLDAEKVLSVDVVGMVSLIQNSANYSDHMFWSGSVNDI